MFGLLGPNGAGKTTLMRIICGVFEQSYGKIFINGIDTQKKREELQGLIGYLPQEFGTYENLTAWEFLEYQALLKGIYNKKVRHNRIAEVLSAVHMYENKDKKIGGFSGGMKQRIGIALILALSNGVNIYITDIQKSTMTAYPISIQEESIDMTLSLIHI